MFYLMSLWNRLHHCVSEEIWLLVRVEKHYIATSVFVESIGRLAGYK